MEDRDFHSNDPNKKKAFWTFLKRIFGYSRRHKRTFYSLIGFTLIVAILEAIYPIIWLHLIDEVVTPAVVSKDYGTYKPLLIKFVGLYVSMGLAIGGAVYMLVFTAGSIKEKVMYDLRKEMFDRLTTLSFSFFDRSATGWLISKIGADSEKVTELISWGFMPFVWGSSVIIGCFTVMFWYSWQLSLIVLVSIPFLLIVSVQIRKLILKYARRARKLNSDITASFNENINGVLVNKSTVQERQASGRFMKLTGEMKKSAYKASFYTATYTPLVVMTGSAASAAVIFWGGSWSVALGGFITIGTLAAFFSYARLIFEPIFDITRFYAMAQDSLSAGERIFSLIDEVPEIKDKEKVIPFEKLGGKVEFKNVNFGYTKEKRVIEDLNIRIEANQSIALVGPTGEGKSTISSLIARFYEPQSGKILIDGTDYRERSLHSYRSQLGILLQSSSIMAGTVLENILYGNHGKAREEAETILREMDAEFLIARMGEEVGDEGSNLSNGEKQLIGFARTLLKDPRILIMDEATASLDVIAEKKIQEGMNRIIRGRTSIIIAHRLSTIKNCDRILVIKKGKAIEDGNHEELMEKEGYYFGLYQKQTMLVA